MNFTEFSFWYVIAVVGLALFVVRLLLKMAGIGGSTTDKTLLAVLSLALFYNASQTSFVIFVIQITVNYLLVYGVLIRVPQRWTGTVIAVIVGGNIGLLSYFKYANFLVQDVLFYVGIDLTATVGPSLDLAGIPPGISFYSFQMIAYAVDTVRNREYERVSFVDYASFVAFFPQVVAGPIERRHDLMPQIQAFRFRFSSENFERGMRWLALGAFMKLVVADNVTGVIDFGPLANPYAVLLHTYLFGLKIYFDFAGYSLMAMGLARILGIQLTLNFRAPYISRNIQEFWRRWHITLSQWFRDYVYIPLGGNRHGNAALNTFIVFTLSGLWHGAGWNYVLWGAYHGALLVAFRFTQGKVPMPGFLAWAITFLLAMFGWLFFMETEGAELWAKLAALIDPAGYTFGNLSSAFAVMGMRDLMILATAFGLAHLLVFSEFISDRRRKMETPYGTMLESWWPYALFFLAILIPARGFSQFVYFAF